MQRRKPTLCLNHIECSLLTDVRSVLFIHALNIIRRCAAVVQWTKITVPLIAFCLLFVYPAWP